jgi:hypothetical protein
MNKVVIYTDIDYKTSEVIYISGGQSLKEITNKVNKYCDNWFYYDIF